MGEILKINKLNVFIELSKKIEGQLQYDLICFERISCLQRMHVKKL